MLTIDVVFTFVISWLKSLVKKKTLLSTVYIYKKYSSVDVIAVPPKIEPFSFPDNIQAGARVHVVCVVSEGDAPMKITWLKDGHALKSGEAVTHQIEDYDLSLRIKKASTDHNGNYTCVASNDAAKTAHTAPLLVHGTSEITG